MKKSSKIKKAVVVLIIILVIAIPLYIYSQGGYQDVHVMKGDKIEYAEERTAKELVDTELGILLWDERTNTMCDNQNFISKELCKWNHKNPYKILYKTEDYIYWGWVRYDFLRNSIVYLYKSKRKEYEDLMKGKTIQTIPDAKENIIKYFNSDSYLKTYIDTSDEISINIWNITIGNAPNHEIIYEVYANGRKINLSSKDGCNFDGYYH